MLNSNQIRDCRMSKGVMRGLVYALLSMAALSLCGCERYRLDRQMEELCKKDGGIKIYETVILSPAEYDAVFKYAAKHKAQEDYYGPEYRYEQRQEILAGKDANPEKGQGRLTRWHTKIYRRSDNKLLGEDVSYGRSGGDGFTFGFHPSSKVCPRLERGLSHSIFFKGN